MRDLSCQIQRPLCPGNRGSPSPGESSGINRSVTAIIHIRRAPVPPLNRTRTNCCDACCCSLWWHVCCSSKPTKYRCRELLWFMIFVLAFSTGLGVGLGLFGVYSFETAPTDMRIINDKYSTLFCQRMSLQADSEFNAFTFPGTLSVSRSSRQRFKKDYSQFIDKGDFKYYNYYLLSSSVVNLVSCSDDLMELYVIKGDNNFETWKTKRNCSSCFLAKIPVKTTGCFLNYNNYSLTVESEDMYYFVFVNYVASTWLTAKFQVNRATYDLDSATLVCTHSLRCDISVPFDTDTKIMYHMTRNSPHSTIAMSSTCNARLWLYLMIFAFGPGITGLILSVIIYFACSDPEIDHTGLIHGRRGKLVKQSTCRTVLPDEETPLLWGSLSSQPPRYEEIDQTLSTCPPSYEEVTG